MFEIKSNIRNYTVEFQEQIKIDFRKQDFLFVDENVYKLYKNKLPKTRNLIIIPSGEKSKKISYVNNILKILLLSGFKKDNKIVVCGGAVCQDVCGFVSSILFRGVEWIFYPTTLVSQADSCIGSKTSINYCGKKNILGTFYPPSKVVICTKFLETLPEQEIKSGIGEILHYYCLSDKKQDLYWIKNDYHTILKNPSGVICLRHILRSLEIKKKVIQEDEFDKNQRNLFQLGHVLGHSIESVSKFSIPHGQAVTKGMDMAFFLSWKRGYIDEKKYMLLKNSIQFNVPEFKIKNIKEFIEVITHDKNNIENRINFILPVGKLFKKIAIKNDSLLLKDLKSYFNAK